MDSKWIINCCFILTMRNVNEKQKALDDKALKVLY